MHIVHTTLTLERHRQTEIAREAASAARIATRAAGPAPDPTSRPRTGWLARARALWVGRPRGLATPGPLVH